MSSKKKFNEFIICKNYAIMKVKRKDIILNVFIDIEDIDRVKNVGSWHAIYDKTLQQPSYYICNRYNSKLKGKGVIKLHRYIMNCPTDKVIDHINHNTLDNRKANLKICTRFENQQNLRSKSTEQTGVYFREKRNVWCANISKNKIRYSKEFKTKENAINWRKEMENKLYKGVVS